MAVTFIAVVDAAAADDANDSDVVRAGADASGSDAGLRGVAHISHCVRCIPFENVQAAHDQ